MEKALSVVPNDKPAALIRASADQGIKWRQDAPIDPPLADLCTILVVGLICRAIESRRLVWSPRARYLTTLN